MKICKTCQEEKPLDSFIKKLGHYANSCKVCNRTVNYNPTKHSMFFDGVNKSCSRCRKVLGLDAFTRNSKNLTGYSPSCRECDRARLGSFKRIAYFFDGVSKNCPTCTEIKPITAFYKCNKSTSGFASVCIACIKLRNEAKRKYKFYRRVVTETHSQCTRCRKIKPKTAFNRCNSSPSGCNIYCKSCRTMESFTIKAALKIQGFNDEDISKDLISAYRLRKLIKRELKCL